MRDFTQFYIDGRWVEPAGAGRLDIIDPSTESSVGTIALGTAADIDRAVAAARAAFASFSRTSVAERTELLKSIVGVYQKRYADLAHVISEEMGAPITLSNQLQAGGGLVHLSTALELLPSFAFETRVSRSRVVKQPIGVCGLVSPWNWPIAQVTAKVAPAIATGCTMVLKPSEIAPMSSMVFAEILHEAGVPKGVFNLVNGLGPDAGACLTRHPGVDLVSFTGSTRAGAEITRAAAESVKRVMLELGGKSANIVLDDADLEEAVPRGVMSVMSNSGQTCLAPTRMLVPRHLQERVEQIARATADAIRVGSASDPSTVMGPLASAVQFTKVNTAIEAAVEAGTRVVAGGTGRPAGLARGFYVKPTIFSDVDNRSPIAREEIFGPVLAIIPYDSEEEAIRLANDSAYGLAGYVQSKDAARAARVAERLEAGYVVVNQAPFDFGAPFGGFKRSGNGREWGAAGFDEYLEVKSIVE